MQGCSIVKKWGYTRQRAFGIEIARKIDEYDDLSVLVLRDDGLRWVRVPEIKARELMTQPLVAMAGRQYGAEGFSGFSIGALRYQMNESTRTESLLHLSS